MTNQPEALRLADVLDRYYEDRGPADEKKASAELRRLHALNQELLEAFLLLIGPEDDPNNGWRGIGGTDVLFACEYCGAVHEDCTLIEHETGCPIPGARAAIAKAEGEKQ